MKKVLCIFVQALIIIGFTSCSKSNSGEDTNRPPAATHNEVTFYKTTSNKSSLFARQNVTLAFDTKNNSFPTIEVDTTQTFQSMEGFGYTLTGGSAQLINGLSVTVRDNLLKELFTTEGEGIGVTYLRISIGASDLSSSVYTYNDLAAGETDPTLSKFNLSIETINFIPVLKQIIAINPAIKILATPWTAPTWMKTNNSFVGGKLSPAYYGVYADYFVKYLQEMKAQGITIDAVTPQNEPLHGGNNPSMEMTATEQADFIKNHLGPKFRAANLTSKIIIYDHNADRPDYPVAILSDAAANSFIDGSAFHLYAGNIDALSSVKTLFPTKHIYFTEQYTASNGDFGGDLGWHMRNLIIGAPRNWSRNVLEWNLANNANYGPHTPGGCTTCLGAVTVNANSYSRNVSYYIIAHASKFVRPGAVRVGSNTPNNLYNVAYTNADGKNVLIVYNDNNTIQDFNVRFNNKWFSTTLDAKAVGTFVW